MKYLKSKAKTKGNIVSVFPSKIEDAYDVKVYIEIAYDYITYGYDKSNLLKITVSDRNFGNNQNKKYKQTEYK